MSETVRQIIMWTAVGLNLGAMCLNIRVMIRGQRIVKKMGELSSKMREAMAAMDDVVPKSEYDNLKFQFDALDHECDRLEIAESKRHDAIEQAKSEVAREIFEDIEKMPSLYIATQQHYIICEGDLADLKKKYTEGETRK